MDTKFCLSLDAGGIRPLLIAGRILESIELRTNHSFLAIFALVGGTSGGAIAAAMLARGTSPTQTQDIAEDMAPKVFRRPLWHRIKSINGYLGAKYPTELIHEQAKEVFGDLTMRDIKRPLVITATDAVANEAQFIKSHRGDFQGMDVAHAVTRSSAAPFYFAPWQGRYVDGGLHSYSPVLSVLGEAKALWPNHRIVVLSIGSGLTIPKDPNTWNPLQRAKGLVGTTLGSGVFSDHWLAREFMGPEDRLFRVEPKVSSALDDVSHGTLTDLRLAGAQEAQSGAVEQFISAFEGR